MFRSSRCSARAVMFVASVSAVYLGVWLSLATHPKIDASTTLAGCLELKEVASDAYGDMDCEQEILAILDYERAIAKYAWVMSAGLFCAGWGFLSGVAVTMSVVFDKYEER